MASADGVIAFGPYILDLTAGRLVRGGTSVGLRPKTFAVLEYLAMHPGRLVATHELLDAVWPDTHVTPSVVTGCIREIRRALGDDARGARFVETVHRRGYRFVASGDPYGMLAGLVGRILALTAGGELAAPALRFAAAVAAAMRRHERAGVHPATTTRPRPAAPQKERDAPSS